MYNYSFEKLEVWVLSKELVKTVYDLTRSFPKEEQFGLVGQLRRAAISVSSNLAEGSSRLTAKDKAHFTVIAFSSAIEIINQIIIAYDLGFIGTKDYEQIRQILTELTNKLNAYHRAQLTNKYTNNPITNNH